MARFLVGLMILCICAFTASGVLAQTDLGPRGMGAKIGWVGPEDVDGTIGFAVFMDMGTIVPQLMLEPQIGFWTKSESEFGVDVSVRDIAVGARAKYLFDIKNSNIEPFVGGGLGLHFVSAEVTVPGFGSADDSEVKLGLDIGGGLHFPVNPQWDILTEVWYGIVSDINQGSLMVGARYNFGM